MDVQTILLVLMQSLLLVKLVKSCGSLFTYIPQWYFNERCAHTNIKVTGMALGFFILGPRTCLSGQIGVPSILKVSIISQWLTTERFHRKNWSFLAWCIEWDFWRDDQVVVFWVFSSHDVFTLVFLNHFLCFLLLLFFFLSAVQNRGVYYTR